MEIIAVIILLDTLEIGEIMKMFKKFGIQMDKNDLKVLFKLVGEKPGSITLQEFKKFSLSDDAKNSMIFTRIQRYDELSYTNKH